MQNKLVTVTMASLFLMFLLSISSSGQSTPPDSCRQKIEVEIQSVSCHGGDDGTIEIILKNTASPEFLWSDGETSQNLYSLVAGSYGLTITDGPCEITKNYKVEEPTSLEVEILHQENITCSRENDGSVAVSAKGGMEPYEFRIRNDKTFSSETNFSGLAVGMYTVEVQDRKLCSAAHTFEITENEYTEIDLGSDLTIQSGESIEFDAGEGYDEYLWSTGEFSQIIQFSLETTYDVIETISVDVIDNLGCTISSNTVTVKIMASVSDLHDLPEDEPVLDE